MMYRFPTAQMFSLPHSQMLNMSGQSAYQKQSRPPGSSLLREKGAASKNDKGKETRKEMRISDEDLAAQLQSMDNKETSLHEGPVQASYHPKKRVVSQRKASVHKEEMEPPSRDGCDEAIKAQDLEDRCKDTKGVPQNQPKVLQLQPKEAKMPPGCEAATSVGPVALRRAGEGTAAHLKAKEAPEMRRKSEEPLGGKLEAEESSEAQSKGVESLEMQPEKADEPPQKRRKKASSGSPNLPPPPAPRAAPTSGNSTAPTPRESPSSKREEPKMEEGSQSLQSPPPPPSPTKQLKVDEVQASPLTKNPELKIGWDDELQPDSKKQNIDISEDVYTVEAILGRKTTKGKVFYLVKWLNFPQKYNSWEPLKNFIDKEVVDKYESARKKRKASAS